VLEWGARAKVVEPGGAGATASERTARRRHGVSSTRLWCVPKRPPQAHKEVRRSWSSGPTTVYAFCLAGKVIDSPGARRGKRLPDRGGSSEAERQLIGDPKYRNSAPCFPPHRDGNINGAVPALDAPPENVSHKISRRNGRAKMAAQGPQNWLHSRCSSGRVRPLQKKAAPSRNSERSPRRIERFRSARRFS